MPKYVEYYYLRRFLYKFIEKVVAVDPLDRPLWAEVFDEEDDDDDEDIQFKD